MKKEAGKKKKKKRKEKKKPQCAGMQTKVRAQEAWLTRGSCPLQLLIEVHPDMLDREP
jgi:hypothetical protein